MTVPTHDNRRLSTNYILERYDAIMSRRKYGVSLGVRFFRDRCVFADFNRLCVGRVSTTKIEEKQISIFAYEIPFSR